MKNKIANILLMAAVVAAIGSCQKIDRPGLGEVVTDGGKGLPTGSLRFFTSFNKTDGPSPRWNDFDKASSFSIAFWIKNAAQTGRTEFLFSLVQPNFSWTNSAAFVLVENQT